MSRCSQTKNFHEISIDDLAKGAGISRPTFYFYFESKEAVLLSLLDAIVSQADAASDAAQAALDRDPARFLRDSLSAYFHYFGAHRARLRRRQRSQRSQPAGAHALERVRERWVAAAHRRRSKPSANVAPRPMASRPATSRSPC